MTHKSHLAVTESHKASRVGTVFNTLHRMTVDLRAENPRSQHGFDIAHHLENESMPLTHIARKLSHNKSSGFIGDVAPVTTHDIHHKRITFSQSSLASSIRDCRIQTYESHGPGKTGGVTGAGSARDRPVGDLVIQPSHARDPLVPHAP